MTTVPILAPRKIAPLRTYLLACPAGAAERIDEYVSGLLAGRTDVVLVGLPILGRDRKGRTVIVVRVLPAGAQLLGVYTPTVTLRPA